MDRIDSHEDHHHPYHAFVTNAFPTIRNKIPENLNSKEFRQAVGKEKQVRAKYLSFEFFQPLDFSAIRLGVYTHMICMYHHRVNSISYLLFTLLWDPLYDVMQ